MRTAKVSIEGMAPYSASRVIEDEKRPGESHNSQEERTWRQRLNIDANGQGIIPPMAFAKAIQKAAKDYCGKVKGAGNTTWSKYFSQGVMVMEPLPLTVTRETVLGERLFVPSDGVPGGGSRVWKTFPVVHQWGGEVTVYVVDDNITPEIFEKAVNAAFGFVGVGRFRPERGGFYGRAEVKAIKWS